MMEQIKIIRSKRKTVSLELRPEGIVVRAPQRMSKQDIYKLVEQKRSWIEKNQRKLQERQALLAEQEPYSEEEIKALAQKAIEVIPPKVKYYAALIGVDYGRISIRSQRTRWGSCSAKGNLNFNCLLMLMPDEIIDSVVVHELCHRKHMDHSADFYAEIERVFPSYQKCRQWLKENGSKYLSRIPQ